jgi:hypothetical protein
MKIMIYLFGAIINVIVTMVMLLFPYGLIGYGIFGINNHWIGIPVAIIGLIFVLITRPITNMIKAWKETNKQFFGN